MQKFQRIFLLKRKKIRALQWFASGFAPSLTAAARCLRQGKMVKG
jgi:hypothetical protein